MKRGNIYLRVGIVIVVVSVAILAYMAWTSTQAQRRTVLTVALRIEPGTVITPEMLSTMEVPAPLPGSSAPFPYLSDAGQVTGRTALVTLLPSVPLTADAVGEPAPPGRLLPSGKVIAPGYAGLALPTDALRSVGGALRISDTVTILVPTLAPSAAEAPAPGAPISLRQAQGITYTVLFSDVLVVDLRDAAGKSLVAGEATGAAAFLVLQLTPAQALEVARYQDVLALAVEAK